MAERLTRNNKVNYYFHDEASNIVYYKLQKLEDIMEKYGIGIDELENIIINGLAMLDIQKINVFKEMELKAERDTWKRACELACKWFKQTGFIGDQTKVDYFYQQAKKEGESK